MGFWFLTNRSAILNDHKSAEILAFTKAAAGHAGGKLRSQMEKIQKNPPVKQTWFADHISAIVRDSNCQNRAVSVSFRAYLNYRSQLPTVLGKGMASRMLPMPVRYMTQRSKPRPKPA